MRWVRAGAVAGMRAIKQHQPISLVPAGDGAQCSQTRRAAARPWPTEPRIPQSFRFVSFHPRVKWISRGVAAGMNEMNPPSAEERVRALAASASHGKRQQGLVSGAAILYLRS